MAGADPPNPTRAARNANVLVPALAGDDLLALNLRLRLAAGGAPRAYRLRRPCRRPVAIGGQVRFICHALPAVTGDFYASREKRTVPILPLTRTEAANPYSPARSWLTCC